MTEQIGEIRQEAGSGAAIRAFLFASTATGHDVLSVAEALRWGAEVCSAAAQAAREENLRLKRFSPTSTRDNHALKDVAAPKW